MFGEWLLLIDTRQLDEGSQISADVCVIGGGPAGLTVALELSRRGVDVAVLESGGLREDAKTSDLLRGRSTGLPFGVGPGYRSRYLGGSSNCWGGWCRPWDPWEFEQRSWVQHSGWPIGAGDLEPYQHRAIRFLELGSHAYDPDSWERSVNRKDVRRIRTDADRLVDIVAKITLPVRFGTHYRDELARSQKLRTFLWANVTCIDVDSSGGRVRSLAIRTLSGRNATARAKAYILATGGIENARLLLASNNRHSEGVGNKYDLVGRYLMDHPRLSSGSVELSQLGKANKFYDFKYHYQCGKIVAEGVRIAGGFMLSPKIQRDERLLSAQAWLNSVFVGERSQSVDALIRLKQRLSRQDTAGSSFLKDSLEVIRHPTAPILFAAGRLFHPACLVRDVEMVAIVEPEPDRESRVTLSTQKDELGVPRVQVTWRLSELVKRTFDRTFEILAEELEAKKLATVSRGAKLQESEWPPHLVGTWHHMGTTRMSDSPTTGVVDRDCKVHDLSNLFVAGSSVFPTAAANYPTITLILLALRLSDHIALELQRMPA